MPQQVFYDPLTGRSYIQGPFGQRLPVPGAAAAKSAPAAAPKPPPLVCPPGYRKVGPPGYEYCEPIPTRYPSSPPVSSGYVPPHAIENPIGPTVLKTAGAGPAPGQPTLPAGGVPSAPESSGTRVAGCCGCGGSAAAAAPEAVPFEPSGGPGGGPDVLLAAPSAAPAPRSGATLSSNGWLLLILVVLAIAFLSHGGPR